ncbi:MAG: hypothetical protein KAR19_14605 [Bacteroidales bacterium]|nr:hypothetical protein [Bacteroidales bacterium]
MRSTKTRSVEWIRESREQNLHLWRNNMVLFISLVLLIFILPVLPLKNNIMIRALLSIVLFSGLFAAEFSRKIFRLLFAMGILFISVMLLSLLLYESRSLSIIAFSLNTFFLILVTIALIAHVATAYLVDRATILCAINSYLLIGLTTSVLFIITDLFAPQSLMNHETQAGNLSSYIYFGFVTLTTLGYGDITPNSPLTRSLSTFAAVFGQLYLVIIIALIIGKYLNSKGAEQ